MPNPMRIQPIELIAPPEPPVVKPIVCKSRFKRLFEKQFIRTPAAANKPLQRNGSEEFEPSSVCLTRMVQNFMEDSNEKQQQKCGKNRCNCFNGYRTESSDEETDVYSYSPSNVCDVLKSLVVCLFVSERNLLADTAKIVERNQISKRKDGFCTKIVADDLIALGYNASICKSKWEKSSTFPAGEYEYLDVIIEGERLIIDIDFRSEFEIARSTKAYKQVLQTLPDIFVGKSDRLDKIIGIVSDAATRSLKKKGMPCPPWRRAGYVKAKWLSPYTRLGGPIPSSKNDDFCCKTSEKKEASLIGKRSVSDNFLELLFGKESSTQEELCNDIGMFVSTNSNSNNTIEKKDDNIKELTPLLVKQWKLPEIKPRSLVKGVKIVTGLASVIEDKP